MGDSMTDTLIVNCYYATVRVMASGSPVLIESRTSKSLSTLDSGGFRWQCTEWVYSIREEFDQRFFAENAAALGLLNRYYSFKEARTRNY